MVENKVRSVPVTASPPHGSTFKRTPLNPEHYGKSADVSSWLCPTGISRSLPTNVRAIPHTINTNALRSKRACSYTSALPEGGQSYDARVNTDNFIEERRDKTFSSGSTPTIVRCQKMYQTEYIERSNEALPEYRHVPASSVGLESGQRFVIHWTSAPSCAVSDHMSMLDKTH